MLWLEKVQLLPTKGLVRNIGHDDSGVHKGAPKCAKKAHNRNVYEQLLKNIVWLENIEPDRDYTKNLQQFIERAGRSPWRILWDRAEAELRKKVPRFIKNWVRAS